MRFVSKNLEKSLEIFGNHFGKDFTVFLIFVIFKDFLRFMFLLLIGLLRVEG